MYNKGGIKVNLWLSILILFAWIFVHVAISKNYYWKTSMISLAIYIIFVFSFFNEFPFSVMFLVVIIFFVLMTISAFLQRDKFLPKGKKTKEV